MLPYSRWDRRPDLPRQIARYYIPSALLNAVKTATRGPNRARPVLGLSFPDANGLHAAA